MAVVIESFRPLRKNTLRGFVRARFASGLIVDDIAIHVGSADGSRWCSPPARPMLDDAGNVMRDGRTGKVVYAGLITFDTANTRHRWQEQILTALVARFPDALDGAAAR